MHIYALLAPLAANLLAGVLAARASQSLSALCGDSLCRVPCRSSDAPQTGQPCIEPPAATYSGPLIERDCYEHIAYGEECATCNVTNTCPDFCDDVQNSGCRADQVICGYVETLQLEGPLGEQVTRGPMFCRKVECSGSNSGGSWECWFTVDGQEVCCVEGTAMYMTGAEGPVAIDFGGPSAAGPEGELAVAGEAVGAQVLNGSATSAAGSVRGARAASGVSVLAAAIGAAVGGASMLLLF